MNDDVDAINSARFPLDPISADSSVLTTSKLSATSSSPELRVCHAPVWKSSFHNRRFDSQYLKQSFPAGFRLNSLRSELCKDPSNGLIKKALEQPAQMQKESFVDWMKGKHDSQSWESEYSEHDDPFADCAGPSFNEIQRARRMNAKIAVDNIANDPACTIKRAPIGFQSVSIYFLNCIC